MSQSLVEKRLGRWASALSAANEAVALSDEAGIPYLACITVCELASIEGALALESGVAHAQRAMEIAPRMGLDGDGWLGAGALATIALVAGRVDEVIERLERVRSEIGEIGARFTFWEADLIEAYVRNGRRRDAEDLLASFEGAALRANHEYSVAVAARCRALLSEVEFDSAYANALALIHAGPWPLELARCELLYGERLRRGGQRAAARTQLRSALARFEQIGAAGFADRARQELQATGQRVRRVTPDTRDDLTPQERQIAALVAGGATNREVAAGVFLSTKTVEKHLSSVYRKLGVRSRTELARLLADR